MAKGRLFEKKGFRTKLDRLKLQKSTGGAISLDSKWKVIWPILHTLIGIDNQILKNVDIVDGSDIEITHSKDIYLRLQLHDVDKKQTKWYYTGRYKTMHQINGTENKK